MIGLTKLLGKELTKSRIMINCVTPAAVKTPIFDQMTQAHIDFMLAKIPMRGFGRVDEMASLVTWLASEECSFSTGGVRRFGGRATYSPDREPNAMRMACFCQAKGLNDKNFPKSQVGD